MLNFLLGRALMRWLEKLGEESPIQQDDLAGEPTSEAASEMQQDAVWVFPKVERPAMGSLFEIYLAGQDREALFAAGEQALDDIERLDRQLSHYREDSDTSRLNANAVDHWVRLEPRMYELIKRCAEIHDETGGAFDITTGPLTKAWGFYRGEGRIPGEDEITELLTRVGMDKVLYDDEDDLVHFTLPGIEVNLGAVGKGYAIDVAAETLRMYGVERAVIHGGQSTIYALGVPPPDNSNAEDEDDESEHDLHNVAVGWEFTIKDPRDHTTPIQTVFLTDEALSTSGNYEQFFEADEVRYSHILDPRTGRPVQGMLSVSVIAKSAADSDALSTAFFVMGRERTEEYCRRHPELKVIMMEDRVGGEIEIHRIGF